MSRAWLLATLPLLTCTGECPGVKADPMLIVDRWADCDGIPTNGCEINLANDTHNCGNCGHHCGTLNTASSMCDHSRCVITCQASFADCDGLDTNGCEIDLGSDPWNCGECGTVCPDDACAGGVCQHSCPSGQTLCINPATKHRSCADLLNDNYNCGVCFQACYGYQCRGGRCEPI